MVVVSPDSRAYRARRIAGALFFALTILLAGCGGKPFNVKARPDLPAAAYNARGESNGVAISAQAVTDEDFLYETYDANLIMAGVFPVRVMITNGGPEPLNLKKALFEIRAPDGRRFKLLAPRRAYSQLISYYGITVYRKDSYKESEGDFVSHALDLDGQIEPGQSREGFVFFSVPGEAAREPGLTLVAGHFSGKRSKSESPMELRLD